MNLEGKVALISGINGFIGRNLAGVLMEKGCRVAGIPRDLLLLPVELEGYIREANPDYIFHLAAYGNHHNQDNEDEIFSANVFKTYMLLHAAKKVKYKAFLNFSSSSVYGKHKDPMNEAFPLEGEGFYARTKVASEYIAKAFVDKFDRPVVNIRPFSVYGPGEAEHRLMPTIVKSFYTDDKLTLYPEPNHDWIYIEDFINAVLTVVDNVDKLKGSEINIGTGNQYSNYDVYKMLCDIAGVEEDFESSQSDRSYDTDNWVADISKLKSIGWEEEFGLEEGLKKTFEFYKAYYLQKKEKGPNLRDAMDKSLDMAGSEWTPLS